MNAPIQTKCMKCERVFYLDHPEHLSKSETLFYSNCPYCGSDLIKDAHDH